MRDLISRQALCDDLREYKIHPVPISSDESEVKGYNDGIDLAISVIAKFPSAESERKIGKWQVTSIKAETWGVCSNCNFKQKAGELNFCPNCGADMRESSNE